MGASEVAQKPIDPAAFRALMSRFATGVTVVTARHRGIDAGMTVNAFLSVSLEPPTVLVSLNQKADTTSVIEASGRFGITVLATKQRHLSELFASRRPTAEKFEGVGFHRGPLGLVLLDGALGALECEVVRRVPHATHVLFLGRIVSVEVGAHALPLVFWRSEYATLSQGEGPVMTHPRPLRSPSEASSGKAKVRRSAGKRRRT